MTAPRRECAYGEARNGEAMSASCRGVVTVRAGPSRRAWAAGTWHAQWRPSPRGHSPSAALIIQMHLYFCPAALRRRRSRAWGPRFHRTMIALPQRLARGCHALRTSVRAWLGRGTSSRCRGGACSAASGVECPSSAHGALGQRPHVLVVILHESRDRELAYGWTGVAAELGTQKHVLSSESSRGAR